MYRNSYPGELPRQKHFVEMVFSLVGHLCGTAVIFVAFFTIGWLVSFFLHWLHSVHPFSGEIFKVITRIEVWVFYADAVLCAIVLIAGALRFSHELIGRKR